MIGRVPVKCWNESSPARITLREGQADVDNIRMRSTWKKISFLSAVGLICAAAGIAHEQAGRAVTAVQSQSDMPSQAEDGRLPAGRNWPVVGGDWTNSRYSTLTQINMQTVKNLGGAWVSRKFEDGAASRSTPIIKDGLMFVTAGTRVYALNAKTGDNVWSYQTDSRQGPKALDTTGGLVEVLKIGHGLPSPPGVAVGDDVVFAGLTDGHVIALNEKTGEMEWSHQIGDEHPTRGQSVSAAPTYAVGMVIAGLANGDFGLRGKVVALDARTGHELWHFFTVPAPGEMGHDTWPKDSDIWMIGGGGVWQTCTVDPDLGMVYFVAGNAVPQYGGELRPGNNLFTNSVIALDLKTGKLRWYYQVVHHDLWDADIATALVLYDAQVGRRARKALAAIRPDGYLFLIDRETGKPLMPVEERLVPQSTFNKTAATQPFPAGADSLLPDYSTWRDKIPSGFILGSAFTPPSMPPPSADPPNILATGFGVRVAPMSYSPQTGYFYAQGMASLGLRRRSADPYYFGGSGRAPSAGSLGVFGAIDSRTNKIAWKKEVSAAVLGRSGSLTTGGGLMFHGARDGNFQAFDAKTGDLLWEFQTGYGGGGGPPATYEIDGEQYVAIATGPTIWAFELGGTLQPLPAPRISSESDQVFTGPIQDTDQIETSSLFRNSGDLGNRYAVDGYSFNPFRASVKVGARVTWTNNGNTAHTIVAQDGSWTTGKLLPTAIGTVVFDKPGTYTYICKEHPWSYGQIIVVSEDSRNAASREGREGNPNTQTSQRGQSAAQTEGYARDGGLPASQKGNGGFYSVEQAKLGEYQFSKNCSSCHMDDLNGNGQVPPLVGDAFSLRWGGRSVQDLYDKIRTTMPQSNPGSLNQQIYLDIVAFLLQSNNFPAGKEDLTNTAMPKIPIREK